VLSRESPAHTSHSATTIATTTADKSPEKSMYVFKKKGGLTRIVRVFWVPGRPAI
jgi:hypothetical protein